MKFYCPLEISRWDDDEYNEISPNEASAYESEINYFISDFNLPEEKERGLMHWYDRGNSVDQKVFSAFMSVEENDEELVGVVTASVYGQLTKDELEDLLTRYARVVLQFLHARIFTDDGNGQPLDGFQLGLVGGTLGSFGRQRVVETGQVEVAERAESLGSAHHLLCAFALVCDGDSLIGREDELVIIGVEERGRPAVRCQSGRVARIEPGLPTVVVLVAARQVAADGEYLADHAVGGAEDARVTEVDVLAEVCIVGDEHRRHRCDLSLLCERRFGSLIAGGVSAFGEGLLDTARKKHG